MTIECQANLERPSPPETRGLLSAISELLTRRTANACEESNMRVLMISECVQVGILPVVHGSALVSAGSSQVCNPGSSSA